MIFPSVKLMLLGIGLILFGGLHVISTFIFSFVNIQGTDALRGIAAIDSIAAIIGLICCFSGFMSLDHDKG